MEVMLWLLIPLVCIGVFALGAYGVLRLQSFATGKVIERAIPAQVLAGGVPAVATVLTSTDTEMRIDVIYILTRLDLKVETTATVPAFVTQVVVPISPVKLVDFAEGRQIRVKVDPATRKVAIDQPVK